MKTYDRFIFDSYAFDPKKGLISLHYSLDDELKFTETLQLPTDFRWAMYHDRAALDRALFALHLIGGISYYKTCLPKHIEIRSGKLTELQAHFWNTVYEHGLGEFFYGNQIDFRGLIDFPAHLTAKQQAVSKKQQAKPIDARLPTTDSSKRVLIPVGGGKDSIVTIELLKAAGCDATLLRLGDHPLISSIADAADLPLITIERKLSPALFKLNTEGALNGHIPITAYLSFLTMFLSIYYGFDDIAMSNERSANEGNVEYLGMEINHQWSKSLEFEEMFQAYTKDAITPDVGYWSLLRPLSELHICKLFTRYPQYFELATSCNTNWRIVKDRPNERWCCSCPKCAFVFALSAAFLPLETLKKIFGKNLFDDQSLFPLYRQLLGIEGFKPFECVGTPEETLAAFTLAAEIGDLNDSSVMQMAMDEATMPDDMHALIEQELTPSKEHAIPSPYKQMLWKAIGDE